MKFITVHTNVYGNVYEAFVNADNINYFQEYNGTKYDNSIIYFAGGHSIEVEETVDEIKRLLRHV